MYNAPNKLDQKKWLILVKKEKTNTWWSMATKKYEPELKAKIALEAIKNQKSIAKMYSPRVL